MPLMPPGATPEFSARLIAWQRANGRHDLPWQNTRDPYRIWLSEIMLQQTQVSAVIPYYQRFLERFPDLASLAAAPIDPVLEAWSGLGYYARARNLHRCAREIVDRHGGSFPRTGEALALLPGIGRSTAAAIAAFAFGERAAILDGNVKRVLSRCFAIEGFPGQAAAERQLWALAENLLPPDGIEAYTQGLMDLGASLCARSRPRCGECPLDGLCLARRDGRQAELPTARPKKERPERDSAVVLFTDGQLVGLQRRPPHGLWGGLLAPPEGEASALAARHGLHPLAAPEDLPVLKHGFTHFRLNLHASYCRIAPPGLQAGESPAGLEWIELDPGKSHALPAPVRTLLERLREHLSGKPDWKPAPA